MSTGYKDLRKPLNYFLLFAVKIIYEISECQNSFEGFG